LGKVMIKWAIVTCLSMVLAIGPGLCCCSARLIFPCEDSGGCCDRGPKDSDHHAHRHHGDSHHAYSHAVEKSDRLEPSPCQHDEKDCPCDQQGKTLFASQTLDAGAVKGLDAKFQRLISTLTVDAALLNSAVPHSFSALIAENARHGELSGREILRAHRKLQC
jgi:hypothetical protein